MKIRQKYICEYCSKEFDTEASAQAHEEKHALELSIVKKNYSKGNDFPTVIEIESPTKEGARAFYSLEGVEFDKESTATNP